MFSGIIEAIGQVEHVKKGSDSLVIQVQKPSFFNDLSIGDSIAVNGVCLTVESFSESRMEFTLAAETLHVTRWRPETLQQSFVNLERSMKLDQRVHGHFVLGHVDGLAKIRRVNPVGDSIVLEVELPSSYTPYIWPKGSVTLNGVSLTINKTKGGILEVCLIPETLRRTNLVGLKEHDFITFEVDSMARAFVHLWEMERADAKI